MILLMVLIDFINEIGFFFVFIRLKFFFFKSTYFSLNNKLFFKFVIIIRFYALK